MNIKITSLGADKLTEQSLKKNFLYKDLRLDMRPEIFLNKQLNKKENLKDIEALYDVEAIKNAVATAFLTSPGDKILNPTYGVDLRRFLFEPIDDFTTQILQDAIETKLPIMEPRITLVRVQVMGDEDTNTYNISLQINVPALDIKGLTIKSLLNSTGYVIL